MNTSANKKPTQLLPVTRDLSATYTLSFVVAFLLTVTSLGGLLFSNRIYPTNELRQSFLANDLVNLLLGLPILLGCMWLTRRGSLLGLLCWPGALLYTFYNYIAYIFGMSLGWLTLAFVVMVLLSGYVSLDLLRSIDSKAVQSQLAGAVLEKISGGILVLFGVAFSFLAVGVIAEANQTALQMTDLGVAIADIVLSTLLFVGGILLFLRKPLGYVSGMGLLFAASALFIGVILVVLLQPLLTDAPFVVEDVVVLSGMALICFIPTGLFMRGVVSKGK
jgi:hypothetical protein